jgi:hypothetical protein
VSTRTSYRHLPRHGFVWKWSTIEVLGCCMKNSFKYIEFLERDERAFIRVNQSLLLEECLFSRTIRSLLFGGLSF